MKKILVVLMVLVSQLALADYLENWDGLLSDYVSRGTKEGITTNLVDYDGIATDYRWKILLDEVEGTDPNKLKGDDKKAFWINTYNIAAVKYIIDNAPIGSIRDAGSILSSVWGKEAITVNSKIYSLKEIETNLFSDFGDPRIHYGVVCASLSCPDLKKSAYRGSSLNKDLDKQKRNFLTNNTKGLKKDGSTYVVSKIFKWHKSDFGNVHNHLGIPSNASIKYMKYNWNVNAK